MRQAVTADASIATFSIVGPHQSKYDWQSPGKALSALSPPLSAIPALA
jgi:hypothetical protein